MQDGVCCAVGARLEDGGVAGALPPLKLLLRHLARLQPLCVARRSVGLVPAAAHMIASRGRSRAWAPH